MRLSRLAALFLILAPLALLAGGCSGSKKTVEISGKVELDDKPLGLAKIKFALPNATKTGESAGSEVIDGEFTVKKAPIGDGIKVVIDTETMKSRANKTLAQQKVDEVKARLKIFEQNADKFGGGDKDQLKEQLADAEKALKEATALEKKFRDVPKKYSDEKTTDLTVSIKSNGEMEPSVIKLSSKK